MTGKGTYTKDHDRERDIHEELWQGKGNTRKVMKGKGTYTKDYDRERDVHQELWQGKGYTQRIMTEKGTYTKRNDRQRDILEGLWKPWFRQPCSIRSNDAGRCFSGSIKKSVHLNLLCVLFSNYVLLIWRFCPFIHFVLHELLLMVYWFSKFILFSFLLTKLVVVDVLICSCLQL